jgi:sec-independent protein translocase protein TatA
MHLGMGFGELVLLLIIVVVVFGATRLPQIGDGLENGIKRFRENLQSTERPRLLLRRREPRRWTISDWLLVLAAVAFAAAVIANALLRQRA